MKTERHEREGHGAVLTICRARRSHPRSPTLVCHPTNSLSAGRVTRDESSTCVDTTCTRLARARIREIIIILTGRYLSRRNRNTLSFLPFFLSCPLIPARAPSPRLFENSWRQIEDRRFRIRIYLDRIYNAIRRFEKQVAQTILRLHPIDLIPIPIIRRHLAR